MQKILLLHGALGSIDQFAELRSLLTDFEIHTFNFSGHGGNKIQSDFSIDLFAQDTLNYLQNNGIENTNIFGYSMGGYVALKLVFGHLDLVDKIMILGTKFNWTKESAEKEVKMLDPEVVEIKVPKFAETLRKRHHPEDWKSVMHQTAQMMTALGNGSAMKYEDFKSIKNEVLICLGSEDNMVTQDESSIVVDHLPNGELMLLEGFKHPVEMVDKLKLAKTIREFMIK